VPLWCSPSASQSLLMVNCSCLRVVSMNSSMCACASAFLYVSVVRAVSMNSSMCARAPP